MIIGAQLYSVRDKCGNNEDLRSTFKALKEMGYQSIQVSGFQYDAKSLKSIADEFGLHIGLTHTSIEDILTKTDEVIERHKILCADTVGVGYPGGYTDSNNNNKIDLERLVNDFAPAVKKFNDAGLNFAYHNHALEFTVHNGVRAIDYLYENTNWNFTFDTGWAHFAGADTVACIKKFADRLKYVHLKDFDLNPNGDKDYDYQIVSIGAGQTPIDDIMNALNEVGTEIAYVEQDSAPSFPDSIEEMRKSINTLKIKGWV